MKILFNTSANTFPNNDYKKPNYGGPQIFTQILTSQLKKTDHSFIAFSLNSDKQYKNRLWTLKAKKGKNLWVMAKINLGIKKLIKSRTSTIPPQTAKTIKIISEYLKTISPLIVFLIGFSLTIWYLLRAARSLNIPTVVSHHGLWFREVGAIPRVNNNAIKIFRKMEKEITQFKCTEIFLNNFSKNIYDTKLIQSSKHNTHIIPLPYSLEFYNHKLPPKQTSRMIKKIGFVGRWDPIKNPKVFLSIAKKANELKKNWKFYAVTKITNSKALKPLIKDFKKFIIILPQTSPKKLKKFYQEMDTLILPSKFDVSPGVVMEAALQNRGTLISPHVGWANEYRLSNGEKWIDTFSNFEVLIKKIDQLVRSKPPKKIINYIIKHHNPRLIIQQHLNLFSKLINADKKI